MRMPSFFRLPRLAMLVLTPIYAVITVVLFSLRPPPDCAATPPRFAAM